MKRLPLLLAACSGLLAAHAQNEMGKLPNFADQIDALKKFRRYPLEMAQSDTAKQLSMPELLLTHPKPGVHRLPQDNMPCIIPDLNASVAMPNAWKGAVKNPFQGSPPLMPDPSQRSPLSPSKPILILPEQKDVTK